MVKKFKKHNKIKIIKQISRDRYLHAKLTTKVFAVKKYRKPKHKKNLLDEVCDV